ncbi:GMC oxidoreductase, partial [Rickenella mellea]
MSLHRGAGEPISKAMLHPFSAMGVLFSKTLYTTNPSAFANQVDADAAFPDTAEKAQRQYKSYDYIVVGGGAAGCVVASRLSEDPNVTVLLVEAGQDHKKSINTSIPLFFGKLMGTSFDWQYHTTPQPGLNNRVLFWPRGKVLGGCSSVNAMMYQHSSPSDFDEWEKLGATGWNYKSLYPFFRKSENFTPDARYPDVNPNERGTGGPWQTSYSHCTPVSAKFVEASQEVGVHHNADVNTSRGCLGVTHFPTFIDQNGRRSSTATAFLTDQVAARPNLTIALETMTTRVLLSFDATPRAIGIEVTKNATSPRFRVAARKEVILSAGAINTPQLLNLSGIGARDELEKHNIVVVKDLPAVGKNLLDHLHSGPVTFRGVPGSTLEYMKHPIKSLIPRLQWYLFGKGPATSNIGEAALFVRSMDDSLPLTSNETCAGDVLDATSAEGGPDLELISIPVFFAHHGHGFKMPPPGSECFCIVPVHLRPLSAGSITLNSSSAFDKPIIDANYFSHPNDLKVLVRGVRLALRIGRAAALQPLLDLKRDSDDKGDIFWPGDADPDKVTDDELEKWIKENAETIYHPVSTARMGCNDLESVVDPMLRVHGVECLRIADASVFPSQISGHPTATVVAVAEKAAHMI